jgi:cold shock CspA family protein
MTAVSAKKDTIMKLFGTVNSFDQTKGYGTIRPEAGGGELRFDDSAFSWGKNAVPTVGQRLSYNVGTNHQRKPCALNLRAI